MKYIAFLSLFLFSFLGQKTTHERAGKDFALFFAVQNYDEWEDLKTPIQNATDIAKELRDSYGFETKIYKDPTKKEILDAIDAYSRKSIANDSQLLIFFSGHGQNDKYGIGYFVPRDGKEYDSYGDSYVEYGKLEKRITALPFRHILVAIDACYSGSFLKTYSGYKGGFGERTGESKDQARRRFIRQTFFDKENKPTQTRLVLTSGGLEKTPDPSEFAKGFLRGLRDGGNKYRILTVNSLFSNYLESRMPKPRKGKFRGHGSGSFLFIRKTASVDVNKANPQLYQFAINKADAYFKKGNYSLAMDKYEAAQRYASASQRRYCGDRIEECRNNAAYARLRNEGDALFEQKSYKNARQKYLQALNYQENDSYCSERIFACDEKLTPTRVVDDEPEPKPTDDLPRSYTERATGVPFEMKYVEGGTFTMGDTFGEGESDEKPTHSVRLSEFWMGETEVTNAQFCAFLNEKGNQTEDGQTWLDIDDSDCLIQKSGSRYVPKSGYADHPVIEVSWYGANAYCKWLSSKSSRKYRLPTEAEWEYAARGRGQKIKYAWGNGDPSGNVADETAKKENSDWTIFEGYTDGYVRTAPVKQFRENSLGLHDMSGNVWEWCQDWYASDYYAECKKEGTVSDPKGPTSGSSRVLRGGSWYNDPQLCRVADRGRYALADADGNGGFRVVSFQ